MTRRPNLEDIVAEQIKLYRNDVSMTSNRMTNAKDRSKTFPYTARAMAEQWG